MKALVALLLGLSVFAVSAPVLAAATVYLEDNYIRGTLEEADSKKIYEALKVEELEGKSGTARTYRTADGSTEIYCTLGKLNSKYACTISVDRNAATAAEAVYFDSILLVMDQLVGDAAQGLYMALGLSEVEVEEDGEKWIEKTFESTDERGGVVLRCRQVEGVPAEEEYQCAVVLTTDQYVAPTN